jgi:acyl-CoA thioesterase II
MSANLRELLNLEVLDALRYRSRHNRANFRHTLFGGQVLGQALMAACSSCPQRSPHSMHAYFLLPGNSEKHVDYQVEPLRDGRSFSHRRVKALQEGREIFTLQVSFHEGEDGFFHQREPDIQLQDPDLLLSQQGSEGVDAHLPASPINPQDLPLEMIRLDNSRYDSTEQQPPQGHFWLRVRDPLHTPVEQLCALAFVSDLGLLASALLPHPTHLFSEQMLPATLDHAMWFHRPLVNLNDWNLFAVESPWADHARGLGRSLIYNRQGQLIAQAVQEGLIRPINPVS